MRIRQIAILITALASLVFSALAQAGDVKLAWQPVLTRSDGTPIVVDGYRVYYGTASGTYDAHVDVTEPTTVDGEIHYTLSGLAGGTKYFMAVTAFRLTEESAYSNEVSYVMPLAPISPPKLLRVPPAQVSMAPTLFGTVAVRADIGKTLTVVNRSGQAMTITAIQINGPDRGSFSAPARLPKAIAPGKSGLIPVRFNAPSKGLRIATARIITNLGYIEFPLSGVAS
jgi:hypothetical protein